MLHNQHQVLKEEWLALDAVVSDSRDVWNDATRSQFETEFWLELVRGVNDYLSGLYDLADTVDYLRQNMP